MTERQYPDMWVDPEDDPRETDEHAGRREGGAARSTSTATGMTLEMKCDGPRRRAARAPVGAAVVRCRCSGWSATWPGRAPLVPPRARGPRRTCRGSTSSEEDRDLDFNGAVADDAVVAEAWASWQREVAHAREVVRRHDDLGRRRSTPTASRVELRDIIVHMIEEYARHAGTPTCSASASTAAPASRRGRRPLRLRPLTSARPAGLGLRPR